MAMGRPPPLVRHPRGHTQGGVGVGWAMVRTPPPGKTSMREHTRRGGGRMGRGENPTPG